MPNINIFLNSTNRRINKQATLVQLSNATFYAKELKKIFLGQSQKSFDEEYKEFILKYSFG